jgi:predicted small lipoprotein YifL
MMKPEKTIRAALILGALLVTLSACQKEGPAEQAGKEVDQATEKAGEQIEKIGDDIQDAAKDAKE